MSENPIVIDLDDAAANDDGTFEPLPEGWYDVVIADVTPKESGPNSKNPGKPMYGYKFKVEEGDFAGRILFGNACLWAEAIFFQKGIQTALGSWKKGDAKFKVDQPDDLIGKSLKVKVAHREYNGETQNEIKRFLASDGKAPATKKKSSGFSL